jgi:hypothetical protein
MQGWSSIATDNSEYSGTRNIGKYSVNGILSVSGGHPHQMRRHAALETVVVGQPLFPEFA